jgi:recombination protein RecA
MVKAIKKSLGTKTDSVVSVLGSSDSLSEVREWIPTGFPDLDRVLGGGWAVGRASEVYGDEGCGKSALSHMAIKQCQRMGGIPVLLDYEVALDAAKMKNVGIDPERLIYLAPAHAEEGWEATWAILNDLKTRDPGAPTLIVWDSIAAAVPKDEMDGAMTDSFVGLHARIMSKGCRKMFREIAKVRAHVMWINQNRSKIGGFSGWGGPQTDTTGGRAVKFAASQRVANRVIGRLPAKRAKGIAPTGYKVSTITDKCRLAPPHRRTEWVLDFKHGPSPELTLQHLLTEAGVIKKAKGPGLILVPWSEGSFKRGDWLERMADPGFRSGANAALKVVSTAGGVETYLLDKKGTPLDLEDEDDG